MMTTVSRSYRSDLARVECSTEELSAGCSLLKERKQSGGMEMYGEDVGGLVVNAAGAACAKAIALDRD